jgi:hypothetical protein
MKQTYTIYVISCYSRLKTRFNLTRLHVQQTYANIIIWSVTFPAPI